MLAKFLYQTLLWMSRNTYGMPRGRGIADNFNLPLTETSGSWTGGGPVTGAAREKRSRKVDSKTWHSRPIHTTAVFLGQEQMIWINHLTFTQGWERDKHSDSNYSHGRSPSSVCGTECDTRVCFSYRTGTHTGTKNEESQKTISSRHWWCRLRPFLWSQVTHWHVISQ